MVMGLGLVHRLFAFPGKQNRRLLRKRNYDLVMTAQGRSSHSKAGHHERSEVISYSGKKRLLHQAKQRGSQ